MVKSKFYCGLCKEHFRNVEKHVECATHVAAAVRSRKVYSQIDEVFNLLKDSSDNSILEATVCTADTETNWCMSAREKKMPKEAKSKVRETAEEMKQPNKRRTKLMQSSTTKTIEIPSLKIRRAKRRTRAKNENVTNSTLEKYGIFINQAIN